MKKRITKSANQALSSSSITRLNWLCSQTGCYHRAENSQSNIWNRWWNIWTTCISAIRIRYLRMSWSNCTKKLSSQHNKHMNFRMKCSYRRTITDLRSMTTYYQNKQNKTRLEYRSAPLTRWSTCQWCPRCQNNCFSWCSTFTKDKLSSILQHSSWWLTPGGIITSFRSGSREIVKQTLTLTISTRPETITATVQS